MGCCARSSTATPFKIRFSYFDDGRPRYQSDYLSDPATIQPGQTATTDNLIFAGAKEVGKINAYINDLHIPLVRTVIDWGWFYFITEPMFYLIDWLYKAIGNFGVAILAVTVMSESVVLPACQQVLCLYGEDEAGTAEDDRNPREVCG